MVGDWRSRSVEELGPPRLVDEPELTGGWWMSGLLRAGRDVSGLSRSAKSPAARHTATVDIAAQRLAEAVADIFRGVLHGGGDVPAQRGSGTAKAQVPESAATSRANKLGNGFATMPGIIRASAGESSGNSSRACEGGRRLTGYPGIGRVAVPSAGIVGAQSERAAADRTGGRRTSLLGGTDCG